MKIPLLLATLCLLPVASFAAPAVYDVDPDHAHPEFEADHFGGLSVWRGLFRKTQGKIILDKVAGTGSVDIIVDTTSFTVGQDQVDKVATGPELLDTAKYPQAHYTGTLGDFVNGAPTTVTGMLTLHGITKPVNLKINSFKCMPHPLFKREDCGADAITTFNRDDFGMDSGKQYGFNMAVTLRIQVEAIAEK